MILDATAGLPYTLWMTPAYICVLVGIILVWLGFLPPPWLIRRLEKGVLKEIFLELILAWRIFLGIF